MATKKTVAKKDEKEVVVLPPIAARTMTVTIVGISPLIQHQWSEKAKEMIRQKGAGRKTKDRPKRDPEAEAFAATYVTEDGEFGIPVTALKNAITSAAHKDIGIEKTLVRKSLFIRCKDPNGVLSIKTTPPVIREDMVRVGAGAADLRYRPEFREWECTFECEVDADLLQPRDLMTLIDRAGFGVGIGEWRPEKNGEFGRFRIKTEAV